MIDETLGYEPQKINITVDICVLRYINNEPHVLLVKRKNDPFKNCYCVPGGYLENFEHLEDGAKRELKEETGLEVDHLEFMTILDNPTRDSRGRTISVVYFTHSQTGVVKGADDALEAKFVPICDIKELGFDHIEILDFLHL